MATLIQERKKGLSTIIRFVVILLVIIIVLGLVWWFIKAILAVGKETPVLSPKFREVKIDFEFLESPALKGLQPFEKIKPFEEEVGRENPFLPY